MIESQRYRLAPVGAETTSTSLTQEPVVATIPQGFDARIKVRFVRARDLEAISRDLGCSPRQGIPRPAVDLLPGLVEKLQKADQSMVAWLAKDSGNARRFMEQPVAALQEAGIQLDRAELKSLDRAHAAVREASVLPPGVRVELDAAAHRSARVTDRGGSTTTEPTRPPRGCGP